MYKCIHCGSEKIIKEIHVKQNAESTNVGLSYKTLIFHSTEPFYADLCECCGTIGRLYVKNVDRSWKKNHCL